MQTILLVILGLLVAACSQQPPRTYTASPDCISIHTISNRNTPDDIFPYVVSCVAKGEYENASLLMLVARVYGRYDMARVFDRTAHQAALLIERIYFNKDSPYSYEQAVEFDKKRTFLLKPGSSAHENMCKQIAQIGKPEYYPKYMVLHGAAGGGIDGLVPDFDANRAWAEVRKQYLNCEN